MITKDEIAMQICSYALFLKEMLMCGLHSSQDFLTKDKTNDIIIIILMWLPCK